MSALVHCDGPGCGETREPGDGYSISLFAAPWLRVDPGGVDRKLDFHNRDCLAAWAAGHNQPISKVVDGL